MAEQEKDEITKKSSKKLILFGGGGVVLLLAVAAGLYFSGMFGSDPDPELADSESSQEETVEQTAVYHAFEPPFMVNYQNNPSVRVMQVELSVMARSQEVIDAVIHHAPLIRNNVLLQLSGQDPSKVKSTEGKLALQQALVEEVNKVLTEHSVQGGIESVFFTSLVMQ